MCTIAMTGQFRVFASVSTDFEAALRYCGVSVLFSIVFSGYLLSVDKLMSDVPWVGWIAVCQALEISKPFLTKFSS